VPPARRNRAEEEGDGAGGGGGGGQAVSLGGPNSAHGRLQGWVGAGDPMRVGVVG
jgi:hypothetical protein